MEFAVIFSFSSVRNVDCCMDKKKPPVGNSGAHGFGSGFPLPVHAPFSYKYDKIFHACLSILWTLHAGRYVALRKPSTGNTRLFVSCGAIFRDFYCARLRWGIILRRRWVFHGLRGSNPPMGKGRQAGILAQMRFRVPEDKTLASLVPRPRQQ